MHAPDAALTVVPTHFPLGQFWHDVSDANPGLLENLPAPQGMQSNAAALLLVIAYLPAAQLMQLFAKLPVESRYLPARHAMQSCTSSLPTLLSQVPMGQGVHCDSDVAPGEAPYLPRPQFRQSEDSVFASVEAYFPATHAMQAASAVLALRSLYLPAAQFTQPSAVCIPVAAVVLSVGSYVPARHGAQSDTSALPVDAAYLPWAQLTQSAAAVAPELLW
jgi:hypothetical protein